LDNTRGSHFSRASLVLQWPQKEAKSRTNEGTCLKKKILSGLSKTCLRFFRGGGLWGEKRIVTRQIDKGSGMRNFKAQKTTVLAQVVQTVKSHLGESGRIGGAA